MTCDLGGLELKAVELMDLLLERLRGSPVKANQDKYLGALRGMRGFIHGDKVQKYYDSYQELFKPEEHPRAVYHKRIRGG